MNRWRFGVCFGLLFAFFSCEKVIDIPVNEADRKIVVEAILKDQPGESLVRLSWSGSVYDDNDFDLIKDAVVTVTDKTDGEVYDFGHVGAGNYFSYVFSVEPTHGYELEVQAEGQVITAFCQTRTKPEIDSLTYQILDFGFGDPDDPYYLVSFHSVDNVDEENYYWVKIFRDGRENNGYYLGNDALINGQYYAAQFFGSEARKGDTVMVEMISMDEANYDYLVGLSSNLTGGPFSASPANPPSNLSGGVLGFFGAYTTDTISIVIPE